MDDIYISGHRPEEEIPLVDLNGQPPQPPAPPEVPQQQKKKKRKKAGPVRKILRALIAVIAAVSLLISGIAFAAGYTRKDLKRNQYVSFGSLANSPFVTNILLLGTDADAEGTTRADSMILVSLDFVHRKIKLTSFLRDCWVEIPTREKKNKLNAAYAFGGAQLQVDTLEKNFGVDIDHYVMVGFEMFTQMIDRLGGVDVEITEKEAQFINRTTRHTVDSGSSVHLDGAKALVYCRIRKLDTDYMRTYRQRKVITALIEKAKRTDPATLFATARDIIPMLTTDLSAIEITGVAYKAGLAMLGFQLAQTRVPTDDQMTVGTKNGQWVEEADLEAVQDYLHDFIYTDKIQTEEDAE
ncbi:MAG: LCP family protein [Clostridia bacterium]|nr:LCP family protein [Clostridia bacterium]